MCSAYNVDKIRCSNFSYPSYPIKISLLSDRIWPVLFNFFKVCVTLAKEKV